MVSNIVDKIETFTVKRSQDLMNMTRHFFKMEAAGGITLVFMAILALIIANSPLNVWYNYILNEIDFRVGLSDVGSMDIEIHKPILMWINDGFMAIFFFLVGLEIKREIMEGELSTRERALLPAIAAVGGMAIPAAIFWYLNKDNPEMLAGWAIPAATDIAFALGVLSLVKSRVPASLKVLLTAVAIIDDLGAIMIIAIFYSSNIVQEAFYFAGAALVVLFIMNRKNVLSTGAYVLVGLILWAAVLKSGVHATLAGVVTALFIPMRDRKDPTYSPLKHMEHGLHPWVAFGILPIFAFANAGVPFAGITLADLTQPVVLGIALGLFVGKQIGVFGFMWLTIKLKLSPKPRGANWIHLYAVSLLCGIGFTMSLFIGGLAYDGIEMQAYVRLGVLMGSISSAFLAYGLLRFGPAVNEKYTQDEVIETKVDVKVKVKKA
jgi:NhaA family Na+:H+ antiporter